MVLLNRPNEFNWKLTSDYSRPASTFGVAFTPGNNTYGPWVQVLAGASMTQNARAIDIILSNYNSAGSARDMLADIGIDPTGGSSYSPLLKELLASCAAFITANAVGLHYHFPCFIPAGSSIGVRGTANSASGASARCYVKLWGQPSRPELVPPFGGFHAIGTTMGSSCGTAVTPGTTSDGDWTSLGTLGSDAWYWQLGFGINNATQANLTYFADLAVGDASNKKIIIENAILTTSSNEIVGWENPRECVGYGKAGDTVYGRMQCSGTPDTGLSLIAYAVG